LYVWYFCRNNAVAMQLKYIWNSVVLTKIVDIQFTAESVVCLDTEFVSFVLYTSFLGLDTK